MKNGRKPLLFLVVFLCFGTVDFYSITNLPGQEADKPAESYDEIDDIESTELVAEEELKELLSAEPSEKSEGRQKRPESEKQQKPFTGIGGYNYCGGWKAFRKSGGVGIGTVELIHPQWAITANHVATKLLKGDKSVKVQLHFARGGGKGMIKVGVTKAFGCFRGDMALLKLKHPVKGIRPVSLLAQSLKSSDGIVNFTMVGHRGGLHSHRNRKARASGTGVSHLKDSKGQRPGKAGDSGGGFVIERGKDKSHVLFAIVHGGGKGPQVAVNKSAIDRIMNKYGDGAQAHWVSKTEALKYAKAPSARKK